MNVINKEIIIKFNDTLKSLLNELSPLIGNKYYFKFNQIVKINSNLPIKYFKNNGLIHKDKILNKDASYFYESSRKSEVSKEYDMLDEIFKFKKVYDTINKHSKENLWTYLQVLTLLAEDYQKRNNYLETSSSSPFAFAY